MADEAPVPPVAPVANPPVANPPVANPPVANPPVANPPFPSAAPVAPSRIVFHVDMDAFYAAVEVHHNPALKGKALVVGADPRGGHGRGVVCTASYEARRFGIRSAMPISQAYRLAPHATFIRPDFAKYSAASDAVMQVLERYADELEVVGLDEAYLDVTRRCGGDWDMARSLAASLQAAVRRETGLSCSIGIAPNKAVAKVATDQRKPHGITHVAPERVQTFLAPLPVRAANGCGPKTAAALADLDIHTLGQLAATPRSRLEAEFGSHGAWLWHVAQGHDDRPVCADDGERKSRGNESTFMQDEEDPDAVVATALDLLGESLERNRRRDGLAYATLTVKIRYAGFVTVTRAQTAPVPFEPGDPDAEARARATVAALLAPLLDGRPVRLVGVRMSGFQDRTGQRPLSAYGVACTATGIAALRMAGPRPSAQERRMGPGVPRGAFNPGGLRWGRLDALVTAT